MWSDAVVVLSPLLNYLSCLFHVPELNLVKAAISEFAVETLYKRILSRFTWLDKMQSYVILV